MINLTIDGRAAQVEDGTTIFNAARLLDIAIPHLCYHPMLSIIGSCRLCVVEVEGARTLPASCGTPVSEGMVVWTESERVKKARRTVIDLLLANHPEDCLTCEKTGDCRLQEYAYVYGVRRTSFAGTFKEYPMDDSNPFFERDHTKCIVCGRCLFMCAENVGVHVYDYGYRGFDTKIIAGLDMGLEHSPCIFCGNCISVCPTAALQPKLIKGKGRVFDLRKVQTICPYCGVGCALSLQVNKGTIVGVVPANGPANHNLLCVKGRFGWDFVQQEDRLKKPLIRKNGELVEASWEEAIDLVARKFKEIKDRHGPDTLAGMSSAKCTNEENYLMQKFMRAVLGTNNVDNSARLCHASTITGLAEAFGSGAATNSIAELESAGVIFIIGSNTTEAHPVVGFWVQKAHRNGAKLIVADPRKTDLAEKADYHLQHLPGTDVALLNGMLQVIIHEKLHDVEFIRERTEGFHDAWAVAEKYTPEYVERITGVPAEDLIGAARLYAQSRHGTILYAMGITQHTSGTGNVRCVANLAMATGNLGRESTGVYPLRGQNNVQGACDMGALPNYLPGYQRVVNGEVRDKFQRAWGVELPNRVGLTVVEMVDAVREGRVKGMYIMGENPMLSNPDIAAVEEGLKNLDFLVVQDIFLTETARLAHVVLPGASFAEKDGTFSNTERRVQRVRRAIPPVGESLPDWEIIARLATAMGYPMDYASPADIMEEIASVTPIYGGITYDRLGDAGLQWPCPDRDHPGTKFLHHERFAGGLGKFAAVEYEPPAELPDGEFPYILVTGRHLYHYHTGTMSRRSYGLETFRPEAYVEVNPGTAQHLGIKEGQFVRVGSRRGEIRIKALVTDRVPKKVIFIPFHYAEAAANVLTNPALDPQAKIPELKVCAARLERAERSEESAPEHVGTHVAG
ncbi:formate dehydrogenase [Clostridiales bacterium PH28_bin88]|nr:formate dehydrogenase [Clostridiales bacterium PH28_bin88]